MDLKEIIAISGLPGLFHMVHQRSNGMIVKSLDDQKARFVTARTHTFTALQNIAVYTNDGSIELEEALQMMMKQEKDSPPVDARQSDPVALYEYFEKVIPDFDRDKVYPNDIKKIIRWYHILKAHDLIKLPEKAPAKTTEEKADSAAKKTPPKKKKKAASE